MKKTIEESKAQGASLKEMQNQNKANYRFLNAVDACIGVKSSVVNTEQVERWIKKGADVNTSKTGQGTSLTTVLENEPIKENLLMYLLSVDHIDVNCLGDQTLKTHPLQLALELDDFPQALRVTKAMLEKGGVFDNLEQAQKDAEFLGNHELAEFLQQQLLGQDI